MSDQKTNLEKLIKKIKKMIFFKSSIFLISCVFLHFLNYQTQPNIRKSENPYQNKIPIF